METTFQNLSLILLKLGGLKMKNTMLQLIIYNKTEIAQLKSCKTSIFELSISIVLLKIPHTVKKLLA